MSDLPEISPRAISDLSELGLISPKILARHREAYSFRRRRESTESSESSLLQSGDVALENGTGVLLPSPQTMGVAQGDDLSLLLFNVLTSDLPATIAQKHDLVRSVMFEDDVVLYSRSRIQLKQALQTPETYSTSNELTINVTKAKLMKSGSGGPPTTGETFRLGSTSIERVRHFSYFGVELSERGSSSPVTLRTEPEERERP